MRCNSERGLLLAEAVLASVVIAVGLVYINRGLGGQLRALKTVQDYGTLSSLAQGKLAELEAKMLADRLLPLDGHGTFPDADSAYRWRIDVSPRADLTDAADAPVAGDVVLTVERATSGGAAQATLQLRAVWPTAWVPRDWMASASNG